MSDILKSENEKSIKKNMLRALHSSNPHHHCMHTAEKYKKSKERITAGNPARYALVIHSVITKIT